MSKKSFLLLSGILVGLLGVLRPLPAAEPKLNDAVKLFSQEKFVETEKALTGILAKSPDAMNARLLMGWALWNQGRYDEALVRFKSVLQDAPARRMPTNDERIDMDLPMEWVTYIDNPDLLQARKGLGWTYFKKGWVRLAHEQFSLLNQKFSSWDEPYLGLGFTFLAQGKFAESERAFKDFLVKTEKGTKKPHEGQRGLGDLYAAQGQHSQAIAQYERALARKPGWVDVQSSLALSHLRAGQMDKASRLFSQLGSKTFEDAWTLYYAGKYRESAAAFEALLKNPGNMPATMKPFILNGLAWSRLGLKETDEAAKLFQASLQEVPNGAEATAGLGFIAIERKEWEKAEKSLIDANATLPGLAAALSGFAVLHSARFGSYDLAWGLYNQGKYREATRAFQALLDKPGALPDSYRSFVRGGIGWSELALGEVERAEQAFKQIQAATKMEEAEAKSGLGWIALRRNRPEQAENLFAEALSAVPGYNAALLGRAQLRKIRAPELDQAWAAYNQGKFDQAATSFNQIAEHSSLPADDRQEAYSGYAWSLYFRAKFQEAAAAFERLLQGRKTADLFYGRGQALAGLAQHQAAAPFLKRAAELVPYSVEYHLAYGWSLLRGGDSKEALAVFTKAYQLAPASAEVNRSLGWAYARENRAAEAKPAFRYALSLIPGYSDDKEFKELTARKEYKELLNDLGWGYVRWQEFDRARTLFEEITKSEPADSDAWFGHGYALYKLGKASEAEKSLDRAIKAKRPAFARTVWVIFPEAGAYPILTDPRSILGWTALAAGKYEQALDRFAGSLNRDPEMVASMVGKAICLARMGETAEARELYLTAQEIYSAYPSVQAGLKENGVPRTAQAR